MSIAKENPRLNDMTLKSERAARRRAYQKAYQKANQKTPKRKAYLKA